MKLKISLLIICLAFTHSAFSWNSSGHQIIAAITWDMLSEKQQKYWVKILKKHPRFKKDFKKNIPKDVKKNPEFKNEWIFRQAAIWPDVVRGLSKKLKDEFHIGTWHYVNLPIFFNGKFNTDHINTDKDFHGELKYGINVIQATQGHIQNLTKKGATKKEQAFALSWILHTVADSHQPMHCSSLASENYYPKGDRGGNDVPINGQGRINNLHWFWDSALNTSTSFKFINRRAEYIYEKLSNDYKNHTPATIKTWIDDCYEIANKYAYTPELVANIKTNEDLGNPIPTTKIDETYSKQARIVAEKQALKAAIQLKAILDSVDIK